MARSIDRDLALETLTLALQGEDSPLPAEGRIGFLRARAHPSLLELRDRLACEQDFKPDADALAEAGLIGADHPRLQGRFQALLLLPDRQKLQTLADFARCMDLLEDGGMLIVSLHNDWGAKRYEKLLAEFAGEIAGFSKHHCRVFWARKGPELDQELLAEWRQHGETGRFVEDRFWSRPGLFSWDEVDEGSRLLAQHLPTQLRGAVADFGAGWGFLSEHLLSKCRGIKSLDLFEADRAALECAQRNLAAVKTSASVRFHWQDVTIGVGRELFDYVVMNVPFHEGRRPDSTLGARFIGSAFGALRIGGEVWFVANRHLPYERLLEDCGEEAALVVQEGSFKVLRARRPAPDPEIRESNRKYKRG